VNNTKTDTTNVYRYKVTTRGKWLQDHPWQGHKKGDPYETIEFRGYYQTQQSWEPWHRAGSYMIVELQKLEAVVHDLDPEVPFATLEWQTIRAKTFGEEQ
jgi:hypothetical protein